MWLVVGAAFTVKSRLKKFVKLSSFDISGPFESVVFQLSCSTQSNNFCFIFNRKMKLSDLNV